MVAISYKLLINLFSIHSSSLSFSLSDSLSLFFFFLFYSLYLFVSFPRSHSLSISLNALQSGTCLSFFPSFLSFDSLSLSLSKMSTSISRQPKVVNFGEMEPWNLHRDSALFHKSKLRLCKWQFSPFSLWCLQKLRATVSGSMATPFR